MKTATTPYGRDPKLHGNPLKITELIAQLEGTCYVHDSQFTILPT
jgi:2-oxoglutarate ferredoxin oxidoreductase subunit beta